MAVVETHLLRWKRLFPKDTPKVKSTIPGGNVRSIDFS